MAKKLIQDIIVTNKKSIRSIQKDDLLKSKPKESVSSEHEIDMEKSEQKTSAQQAPRIFFPEKQKFFDEEIEPEHVSKKSNIFLWVISAVSVAVLPFLFSLMFATATVTITPKKEPIILNNTYTISATSSISGLHYQILTLEKTLSQSLPTNGQQDVEIQGTGKAIIYNDYSSAPQRLINNTRLETSDGVIYRIRSSVVVPGITTVNGVKTPGSVEVDIISDLPGAQYNMKVSDLKGDFTIPGFEGDPEYNSFYARLATDVAGGFIGTAKTVDPTVLAAGRQNLINTLTANLIQSAYATTSEQNTILKNNYFIQTTDLPDTPDASSYTISEQATLYAIVFNTNDLATFIAKNTSNDYDGSPVDILWGSDISATSSGTTVAPWTENSLTMQLSGDADIVWSYDANAILNEIRGKNKSVLQDILTEDKNSIVEIQANIRPEWNTSFPDDAAKIKIINSVLDTQTQ